MKKTYMTPIAQEIKLKYQFSLLSNSITSELIDNNTVTIDDGGGTIVDNDGTLDPDAREFDLDDEEEYF
jgi:hypothetical protein